MRRVLALGLVVVGWSVVWVVQRETRHHVAGLLASEPAERIREADGREFIALADAQRIARLFPEEKP